MLHALAWDLFQMTQSEYACLLPAGMADNLQNACLNMSRPFNVPYLPWPQQVELLHETHENIIQHATQDTVVLAYVLRGNAVTVNDATDLCKDKLT